MLSKASGELFFWADEDDLRDITWVEELVSPFIDNSVTFSIGLVEHIIDQQGLILGNISSVQFTGNKAFFCFKKFFIQPERFGKCNLIYALLEHGKSQKIKTLDIL